MNSKEQQEIQKAERLKVNKNISTILLVFFILLDFLFAIKHITLYFFI